MSDNDMRVTMTENEMRNLIRQTVHDTLTSLGIEHNEPFEMQKDFQHLREWRNSCEGAKKKAGMTLVGFAVMAVLGAISLAFKEYFKN